MTAHGERVLGLDVGERRIGLAVSDDLGWMAHGIPTLERTFLRKDLGRLRGIIAEHQIKKLVVGLPRNMNGGIGPQAVSVLAFIEVLKTRLQIDVIPWDERLTTAEAERALISADLSREKRRKKIDQVAAVLILQGYLDYRRLAHTAEYTKPDNS